MKTLYSYPEIQHLIEQGEAVTVTCHIHAEVTAIQKRPGYDTITATIHLLGGEYVIAVVENEYPSMVSLLDAFDIDENAEQWEVREQENNKARYKYAESHTGEGIIKE